ncbi:hypothetical protein INR49_022811 [Caranx melampygus]|nr:hypothetical protein INR49_022811 [Caranx melampygus]
MLQHLLTVQRLLTVQCVLTTKAAYVLFYQRRETRTPLQPQPSASLGGAPDAADDHMDTN